MDQKTAFEIASSYQFDTLKVELGPWTSYSLLEDPKHMSFVLGGYNFGAKMLRQGGQTLEVGCDDRFSAPIARQHSGVYVDVDVDSRLMDDNNRRLASQISGMSLKLQDITEENAKSLGKLDTLFSVDVLEHLDADKEKTFLESSIDLFKETRVYICGTPSAYYTDYALECSRILHIDLKTAPQNKEFLKLCFHYLWIFSMNDEVVHTSFYPMAHYLFALCAGKK